MDIGYNSGVNPPFRNDVEGGNLAAWCAKIPNAIEGIITSSTQLLGVEAYLPTLNQTRAPIWCVYCWCDICQIPFQWGGTLTVERSLAYLQEQLPELSRTLNDHVARKRQLGDVLSEWWRGLDLSDGCLGGPQCSSWVLPSAGP